MKKIFWFLATLFVIIMIGGCGKNNNGLSDFMTLDELKEFMDDGTGFIFVTSESFDDYYEEQIRPVENALKENNASAVTYHVYKEDGKNRNNKGERINPYSKVLPSDSLSYVKDGTVVETLRLSDYEEFNIGQNINDFVKKFK